MDATISNISAIQESVVTEKRPAWAAIFSMAMVIIGLIMAEFLPISLLTPIAQDLKISEGAAGQAITVTAIVAFLSSLFSAVLTRRIDRRIVILSFTGVLIFSSLLVAFAPNYPVLLIGRVFLGIGLGGFWSMAAAIAMRLVPQELVPRAFSIIFGAATIATAVATPLGSFLGDVIGWRGTFIMAAAVGIAALVWQFFALPSLPPIGQNSIRTLIDVIRHKKFRTGIFAVLLVFAGHFAFFTYLRPFLETNVGVTVNSLSVILLLFGLAAFAGSTAAGVLLQKNLWLVLIAAPLLMVVFALALITTHPNVWGAATLITLWGFAFGTLPVAWSTWVTHTVPDKAESGGALLVASIQFAITIGAAVGGILLDRFNVQGTIIGGILLLLVAVLTICIGLKVATSNENGK